jgi:phosphoesterase RecJ-like protein
MTDLHSAIQSRLQAAGRVLIVSHIRPDGDAIGSMLALGLALQNSGKQVQMVLSDGVPSSLKHLPGSEQICKKSEGRFDLVVTVDCSDLKRTGDALDGRKPDIVIDHHATTDAFGTLNLVEPEAVATASILTRSLPRWGFPLTAPIAANLLTGIIIDTIGFRTSNVTPEALRQAADLLALGADMSTLYHRALVRRTFAGAKYWGAGLTGLTLADGIVWATLTLADRKAAGYTGNDDADLINEVSAIDDADIAIMFVEQNKTKTKISWRGLKPHVDVASIAVQFGGGGHKAAAGAEINGSLSEVRERVLEATRKTLQKK